MVLVMADSSGFGPESREPLRTWERTASLLIGVVFGGLAILALFDTANQAGTAALVVVAAAFLLIGIQGTALIRLGGGSASVELERKQAAVAQRVSEVAERDPQLALGIIEGATIAEPRIGPGAGAFLAKTYKDNVRRAVERVKPENMAVSTAAAPIDYMVASPSAAILVSVVYRRSSIVQQTDLAPLVSGRQLEGAGGGLVIANRPSDASVTDYVAAAARQGIAIDFVTWNGTDDDRLLSEALARLAARSVGLDGQALAAEGPAGPHSWQYIHSHAHAMALVMTI